jgi:L-fuculose-phosphate aldolase
VSTQWTEAEARLRKAICEIGALSYQRNFLVGADGNISARMADGTILITPAGAMKGFLQPPQIAHIDMQGEVVDGGPGASTERGIHIVAYEERPEMKAVVHAHPPHAVAMTIAGIDLQTPFIPEVVATIGGIPTVPFGTPGTDELGESIRATLRCSDTVLMTHHGSVTLGANLLDAYKKLDMIEHTARILYLAHSVGRAQPLARENVDKLMKMRKDLGIQTKNTLENQCGAPSKTDRPELRW